MSYDQNKPTLLYLSPTVPSLTGNGSAMRAGAFVELLAKRYNVQLLVVTHHRKRSFGDDTLFLQRWCSHVSVYSSETTTMDVVRQYRSLHLPAVQALYVFRLRMVDLALALMEGAPHLSTRVLDLDDYESKKFFQLASYYSGLRHFSNAYQWQERARYKHQQERLSVAHFTTVLVANLKDAAELAIRFPRTKIQMAPNVIRPQMLTQVSNKDKRSLLFVGSLQYFPNEDAVLHLCWEILPILRELYTKTVEVHIVGSRPSAKLVDACRRTNVLVHENAQSVRPFYEQAIAALVPLRLGGGTRIKLLEALSFAVPVVTTSLGADGMDLRDEVHALFANDATDFARQCIRILSQEALAISLAKHGREWVVAHHSLDALDAVLYS